MTNAPYSSSTVICDNAEAICFPPIVGADILRPNLNDAGLVSVRRRQDPAAVEIMSQHYILIRLGEFHDLKVSRVTFPERIPMDRFESAIV